MPEHHPGQKLPPKVYDPDDPNPIEEEDETSPGEITRRAALKAMVVTAVAGVTASSGAASIVMLFQPKVEAKGSVADGFIFKESAADTPTLWYRGLDGKEVVASDFTQDWQGAATFWRYLKDDAGNFVEGTGIPAIIFRINPAEVKTEWGGFFDFLAGGKYMAVMAKCLHACCVPNWQNSRVGIRTIYCVCHDSEYDPKQMSKYTHLTGAKYWGVARVAGPTPAGMPLIPVSLDGDRIVGRINPSGDGDLSWYQFCGVTPPR